MSQPFIPQNNALQNAINLFQPLSSYAPIIICMITIAFSIFTATWDKALAYIVALTVATFLRMLLMTLYNSKQKSSVVLPEACLKGTLQMLVPGDITYSTFVIIFTMIYMLLPMVLISKQMKINMMNYGMVFFFAFYLAMDIFVKATLGCFVDSNLVLINIFVTLLLSASIVFTMYGTSSLKHYLYINELNSNKEVCSMPSKQQFKCNVYRNGELVGNI